MRSLTSASARSVTYPCFQMSQLEIFPQKVIVYPSDQQLFELRSTYPPPLWKVSPPSSFGVVQPDYSVQRTSANLNIDITAYGVYQLKRGLGTIEWTLNGQSVPTSEPLSTPASCFSGPSAEQSSSTA